MMKKHSLFLLMSFLAASLWGQAAGTEQRENTRRQPLSISGTLVPAGGFIALKSGDTLYYTIGLERLAGFIDGVKENAQVNLEGYEFGGIKARRTRIETETRRFFRVTKLEIGGRSYETGRGDFSGSRNFRAGPGFRPTRDCGPNFGRKPGFDRSGRRGFDRPGSGRRGFGRHRGRPFLQGI
ncbi:MAG: hypothetical protein LBP29_05090 [Treponema sp.]|jgi:hypothetical protein|nr:hypothetical protein [Treponema sp.]